MGCKNSIPIKSNNNQPDEFKNISQNIIIENTKIQSNDIDSDDDIIIEKKELFGNDYNIDIIISLQKEIVSIEIDDDLIENLLRLLKKYINKINLKDNTLNILQKIINIFDCNVYDIISNLQINDLCNLKKSIQIILFNIKIFTSYDNERNKILQGLQLSDGMNKNYLDLVEKNNDQIRLFFDVFSDQLNKINDNIFKKIKDIKDINGINTLLIDIIYIYNIYINIIKKVDIENIINESYSLILSKFMIFLSEIYFQFNNEIYGNFFTEFLPNTFNNFLPTILNNVNTNSTLYQNQLKIDIDNVKNQLDNIKNLFNKKID